MPDRSPQRGAGLLAGVLPGLVRISQEGGPAPAEGWGEPTVWMIVGIGVVVLLLAGVAVYRKLS